MKNLKKTITFLFIIGSTFIFSQEKVKEIKLDKKENLNFLKVANDGTILLKTNKEVYGVVYKTFNGNKLMSLDKNLDTNFEIEVANTFPKGFLELSPDLKYTINSDQLIGEKGKIKEYPYGKKNTLNRLNKKSGLSPVFHFFNDYGWSVIGPKSGRKNLKKKYDNNDIFIFNLRNEDLKSETFLLKSPEIITNEKSISWQLIEQNFKNSFFLGSKDKISKDFTKEVYHVVENTYNGEIASYSKLEVNLEQGKYFLPSHSNGIVNYENSAYGGGFGYGATYINNETNTVLVYGYYSNKKGKQHRVGNADGIYAYQFKKGGELIWKSYFPFKKTINGYLIKRQIEITPYDNLAVIHCYLDDLNGFFKIDLNTGNFLNNSSNLIDFFENKKILKENYFLKLNMMSGAYFFNVFKDNKTNKNNMTSDILTAIILKPEIKEFMLNRSSTKKNVSYNAKFSKENIYISELTKAGRGVKEKTLTIFKF
jgi:hypothetical protein